MMSADPNFSPVAVEPGPDGALYVLDACGKESPLRAGSWGRIWRIASSRLPPVWEMAGSGKTAGTLLGELCRAAPERGWSLRLELWQRPDEEVFGAWSERFNSLPANDPSRDRLLLEGLRLHQAFGVPDLSLLSRLTDAADPNARLAACDVLADWFRILPGAPALLHRLVEDENPRVRLAALDSARRVGTPEAGDLARLSLHQRMDGDLRRVSEATIAALGGPDHAPPSLRAKAMAMSTTELIAAPLTPPAASVLLERSGVENAALRQAANLLSARSGLSLERWIVARLEDRNSPGELIDNLVKLLTMTEGWELYQSGTQLQSIAQNIDRLEVRRAVYGALAIGAAESQTLDALLARVEASGDYEVTTFYEGCAQVLTHPKLRAAIAPAIRNELGNDDSATRLAGRRLRITAPGWGVLHFAELEAFAGDQNVAHGRPVKQSEATGPTRWWSTLAKNGVNGIRDWQAELPLKGLSPDSVPVRGVMAGNVAGGDPFWEVDFESSVPIDRLVYFPGERLPAARTLRFELFDPSGQVVWRATRATSNADPLEINLDMAAQRIQQAVAVARLLGDEFTKSLETVARHSALLPARFSAMRALRRMGVELQGLRMRTVDVVAGADGFDLSMLSVHAQDAIELTVRNESGKELNLAWFEDETAKSPVVALGTVASSQRGRFPFVVPSRPGAAWIRPVELIGKERLRLPVEVSGTPESAPGKK
jgi:hypothetical protein